MDTNKRYINFIFQKNKYKKSEKDAEWVGYTKNSNDARIYFVKIFKNNGQYGEYMSGSIDLDKLDELTSRGGINNKNEAEETQGYPQDFPVGI